MLVDDCVIMAVKAVEKAVPMFGAQALRYLRLTGHRRALVINFITVHGRPDVSRLWGILGYFFHSPGVAVGD